MGPCFICQSVQCLLSVVISRTSFIFLLFSFLILLVCVEAHTQSLSVDGVEQNHSGVSGRPVGHTSRLGLGSGTPRGGDSLPHVDGQRGSPSDKQRVPASRRPLPGGADTDGVRRRLSRSQVGFRGRGWRGDTARRAPRWPPPPRLTLCHALPTPCRLARARRRVLPSRRCPARPPSAGKAGGRVKG